MVQFVNLENMVPFLDGFEKFGVPPRASNAPLRDGMFAHSNQVRSVSRLGNSSSTHARQRGKVILPLQRYGSENNTAVKTVRAETIPRTVRRCSPRSRSNGRCLEPGG